MQTLFDSLPLDIINYVIKPFIGNDYFARIAINSILPPIDRQGSPLKIDAAKQLGLSLSVVKLKRIIGAFPYSENSISRSENIIVLFDYLLKNPLILQHNSNFRQVTNRQANTFADSHCPQYKLLEETAKTALVSKANLLLQFMEKTPFLYTINTTIGNEKWSAVSDTGVCVVVDNSRALAIAEKAKRSIPHWRPYISRYSRYYPYSDDEHDEREFGYYDANEEWVCLRGEWDDTDEEEEDEEIEVPRVSRRGTVKEADGWERVVIRKDWNRSKQKW